MRSVPCPPLDADGVSVQNSEPAVRSRAWQSFEESVSGRRCAAIVTRSHGRTPIALSNCSWSNYFIAPRALARVGKDRVGAR
eukprot:1376376-Prymnesium_polylepis.1